MEVLAYEGTDGELTLHPTLEDIRAFLERDKDYWQGGSGSAVIAWVNLRDEGGYSTLYQRPSLHLIVHEPYGIHLVYMVMNYQPHTSNIELMSLDENAPSDLLVEHDIGGEPAYLPRQSFLSQSEAMRAIADFLQTEMPSPAVVWKPKMEALYQGCAYRPMN